MSSEQSTITAEQHVIGGLLLDGSALDRVADIITEKDFALAKHQRIYAAIRDLDADGTAIDLFTVESLLIKRGELESCGGLAYLGALQKNTPSAANVHHYAKAVRDASLERQLLAAAGEIERLVRAPGDTREKLDRAQVLVSRIADVQTTRGPVLARSLLLGLADHLQELSERGGGLIGQSTGFDDLDRLTCGLQPSDLIVIAGRPSMGKTTFAMNIAEHAVFKNRSPVAVFSMEMSSQQLLLRSIASMGRIPFDRVRSGNMDDAEWARFTAASGRLAESKLLLDDTPGLTVMELRARARRLHREHGLGLIVIDYLQLMEGAGENRNVVVTDISRGLKSLAKELNVPVIALSQLNRSLEKRETRRPVMSDLRESGAIEQDADVIAFIYRDEVYRESSPAKGTAEIIIGKQRNGDIGTVRLTFLGRYCRFENYAGPPINEAPGPVRPPKKWAHGFEYSG